MKKLKIWMLTSSLILFMMSCDRSENIVCEGECEFVIENTQAEMVYMNCFEKYGIKTVHPDDDKIIIYGIPESVKEKFQVDGKTVTFTAKFRPNTLQPIFPDPEIGPESLYEIELVNLK